MKWNWLTGIGLILMLAIVTLFGCKTTSSVGINPTPSSNPVIQTPTITPSQIPPSLVYQVLTDTISLSF